MIWKRSTARSLRAKLEERRRKVAESKQIEIDQTHVFIARALGDRILLGNTYPQSEAEVRELIGDDADKKVDLAAITGAEEAKGIFARFLKAHSGQPGGINTPRDGYSRTVSGPA